MKTKATVYLPALNAGCDRPSVSYETGKDNVESILYGDKTLEIKFCDGSGSFYYNMPHEVHQILGYRAREGL